jgi:hypothetical protein
LIAKLIKLYLKYPKASLAKVLKIGPEGRVVSGHSYELVLRPNFG